MAYLQPPAQICTDEKLFPPLLYNIFPTGCVRYGCHGMCKKAKVYDFLHCMLYAYGLRDNALAALDSSIKSLLDFSLTNILKLVDLPCVTFSKVVLRLDHRLSWCPGLGSNPLASLWAFIKRDVCLT